MIRSRSLLSMAHNVRDFCDLPQKISWQVIGESDYSAGLHRLPLELQYALAIHPSRVEFLKSLLAEGHALAMGRNPHVNADVSKAIERISAYHRGALHPWLEDLIVKNITPAFSEIDLEDAAERGMDLFQLAAIIKNHAAELIQIKIVESGSRGVSLDQKQLVAGLAHDIQKIYAVKAAEILCGQAVHKKRHTFLLLIFGTILLGPIVHLLEMLFSGLGKFAAVIFPILLISVLDASFSYKNGEAWWQIKNRFKKQRPEMIILLAGAVAVEMFFASGLAAIAGLVFFLSANSFALGQSLRRLLGAKTIYSKLIHEGKLARGSSVSWLQIFYGPLWIIYALSFSLACGFSVAVFVVAGEYIANGWLLIYLASSFYIFLFLLTVLWSKTATYRFRSRLSRLLRKAIIS